MFRVEHLYKHVQESVKVEWNLAKDVTMIVLIALQKYMTTQVSTLI